MSRYSRFFSSLLTITVAFSLVACSTQKKSEDNLSPAQIMAKLRAKPGVKTLPSGLSYKVLSSGPKDGEQPHKGDIIMVVYEGRLPDGSIFDSSTQHGDNDYIQMPLDGLIKGWMEALPMMHVGDTWMLYVPAKLGYGHKTMGIIPPDSPLIFRIKLLGIEHATSQLSP